MKYIYNIHHYLGTFFFGMFLIWFLSGFVMMYKSFPFLSEKTRIAGNEILSSDLVFKHPLLVFPDVKKEAVARFRANNIAGRLVYHLEASTGLQASRYADTGLPIKMDQALAKKIAQKATSITHDGAVEVIHEVDQWIPRPKFLKHLPVYRVQLTDPEKTMVHVSSLTGEILNITSRSDRVWAWLGAIPHWIYFKDIRIHRNIWSQLILWLAGFGFVMSFTGIITVLARYKKKPKARFRRFKNKWYNVHYYTGLGFGLFVCTWVFSGFMSMTPFNWVPGSALSSNEMLKWQGKALTIEGISEQEWSNLMTVTPKNKARELSFFLFDSFLFVNEHTSRFSKAICLTDLSYHPSQTDYQKKVNTFDLSSPIVDVSRLNEYDNYYYDRKNLMPLPVIRATNTANVSYYIDPVSCKVVKKVGTENRWERWLYHGLHSLDFSFLTQNRPLWDIVVIFLLLGGTLVSITAVGLGVKFIKRKTKKALKKS